jgi:tetratricopeptide (TPR) repeat protein
MLHRAPIEVVASIVLFAYACIAQIEVSPNSTPTGSVNPGLQGMVLNADGKPASGIHVELDEPFTALPITSTYTERDGTFELYNIPKGNYELVAESTDSLASPVIVTPGESHLKLRLQPDGLPVEQIAPTISVAQMMVPESAQKPYRKAQEAYKKQQYDKSLKLVNEALQIEPRFADALTLRGYIELISGDITAAQQDFENAVHVDPNCEKAYLGLGTAYNHQGRFDDAMRASQRSLSLSPKSWQAYFEMAKASIAKGMYSQGLQLARQAQRLSGNSFAAVHLIKAYALVPMRMYKDAKYELQAFLSREPKGNSAQQAQTLLAEVEAALPPSASAHP